MFKMSTGEIVKYNAHLYNSSGKYLQMYKGWTPYFTIEGDYIGCHIGGYYRKPDKRYVRSYWVLNNGK
jgi:hypothetical protein